LPQRSDRRALIIGGSISGLLTALFLRQSGWHVDVFERSKTPLAARGAGIVTHPALTEALAAAGVDPSGNFGVEITGRKAMDKTGRVIGEYARQQVVTSWDRMFRMLFHDLPAESYHFGQELIRFEERSESVTAYFSQGQQEGDLLIGADGFRSTVRAQCLPEVRPNYAGYVAWRGLITESKISGETRRDIFDSMAFCLPPGEQMLGYPVAGVDNDLREGHRRYNSVWYRPADKTGALQDLLTDEAGAKHALSIPPPLIRKSIIAALRDAAETLLAPQFREIVRLAPRPFLQPIYDLASPRIAMGRVALIGDAAFLARPHVGAGVTKAAHDAHALASALHSNAELVQALERFEQKRLSVNRRIVERARELGAYLEAGSNEAGETARTDWKPTPQAHLANIALLDFLDT
jgi:2-polyprenyl-6-methoxyphenol hydroxylase-like FAD-dependent oxidoreductase